MLFSSRADGLEAVANARKQRKQEPFELEPLPRSVPTLRHVPIDDPHQRAVSVDDEIVGEQVDVTSARLRAAREIAARRARRLGAGLSADDEDGETLSDGVLISSSAKDRGAREKNVLGEEDLDDQDIGDEAHDDADDGDLKVIDMDDDDDDLDGYDRLQDDLIRRRM